MLYLLTSPVGGHAQTHNFDRTIRPRLGVVWSASRAGAGWFGPSCLFVAGDDRKVFLTTEKLLMSSH